MSPSKHDQGSQATRQRRQGAAHISQRSIPSATKPSTAKTIMAEDMKELEGFLPNRLPLQWNLPESQLTDDFFAKHYTAIVSDVMLHVGDMFRVGDIPPQGSIWTIDAGRKDGDLESIVRPIARPSPSDPNPWDDLMACSTKRPAVMLAVFMEIYSRQLFSVQLFGADDKQRQTLTCQDEQFIGHEGFRRSKLRATTVRTFLDETHGLPPHFWAHVDQFASRVFKLLHPALTWVRMTWPKNGNNPSIRSVFQRIHQDTAYAAWFAVNVRMSPAVLEFDWRLPGERYLPDQAELYPEVYRKHQREVLERERNKPLTGGVARRGRDDPKPPKRTARVMISVVPRVQRFTLIAGAEGEKPLGFHKTTLLPPQVVYYQGLDNDQDDAAQFRQGPPKYLSRRNLLMRALYIPSIICFVISIVLLVGRLPWFRVFRYGVAVCQAALGGSQLPLSRTSA
ncbi:hypothetical protein CDEST_12330 [Colletotrichum destructivum]|uniref:Uncharacterized protein n=1 Tax=Colletotrichum destructivum TaxID=34406 RepID=A0AAX4IVT5_9PEZI|nr:hypothetical protein CDEST_12330 [Colletotrichum destructivum]